MSLLQVLTAFTPGCLAAGEYTNASRRLVYPLERVANDDQSMVCGQAECNPSVFVFAMLRIIQGDSFGVREDRGGQLKADAVFLLILLGLVRVPLKDIIHHSVLLVYIGS